MKTKKIIVCFLIILCLISQGCSNENTYKNNAEIRNELTINSLRMSAGINSLNFNEKNSSSFYTNSKNLYITGTYENAGENSAIKFILKYQGKEIRRNILSCNDFSSDFRTYFSSENGWKSGNYCVEIYIENNKTPIKTMKFSIKTRYNYSGPTVYITKTGAKYHSGTCRCLSKSKIPISLKDAKRRGYDPCGICKPPK